jgi:hypothetical protein
MTINDLQYLSQFDGDCDELGQTIGGRWNPQWDINPHKQYLPESVKIGQLPQKTLDQIRHFPPQRHPGQLPGCGCTTNKMLPVTSMS